MASKEVEVILNARARVRTTVKVRMADIAVCEVMALVEKYGSYVPSLSLCEATFELVAGRGRLLPVQLDVSYYRSEGKSTASHYLNFTVTTSAECSVEPPILWAYSIFNMQDKGGFKTLQTGPNSNAMTIYEAYGRPNSSVMNATTLMVGFEFTFWDWDREERDGSLQARLAGLRLDDNLSDFALVSADGKRFPCSKLLLAANSDVFKAMFKHEKNSKELKVEDANHDGLEVLMSWLYSGTADGELEGLLGALALADKYHMSSLFCHCETELTKELDASNVDLVLAYAHRIERADFLKRKCLEIEPKKQKDQKK